MEGEGQETINNDAGADAPSVSDMTSFDFDDGLVSTVELPGATAPDDGSDADADPEGAKNTQGTSDDAKDANAGGKDEDDKGKEGTETDKGAGDGESTRYDKDPAWQRIMKERDANFQRAVTAEAELKALQKAGADGSGGEKELDFKDISKLTVEEIQEWKEEDPKGYEANLLRQAKHEIKEELQSEFSSERKAETDEAQVQETFDAYADENEDFLPMWKSGELQRFMDRNPGHNAISAHLSIMGEKNVKDAVAKAEKDTEKKIIANIKAKGLAKNLSAGPSNTGDLGKGASDELQNPGKYGGTDKVLLNRHIRRMQDSQ